MLLHGLYYVFHCIPDNIRSSFRLGSKANRPSDWRTSINRSFNPLPQLGGNPAALFHLWSSFRKPLPLRPPLPSFRQALYRVNPGLNG